MNLSEGIPAYGSSLSLARAIVRENNDPDQLGRVRVEYPWFQGKSAEMPSEWARVCTPYASGEHGAWFLPEVGTEVIVYFESGNLDFPIVMGSLYSKKQKPPGAERSGDHNGNNKNDLRYIKTRSGHLLCFDDSSGDPGVFLKDHKGSGVSIESKKDQTIFKDSHENRVVLDGKGKKVLIADSKDNQIELEGSKIKVQNKNGSHVTIDGGKVTIHGGSQIHLGEGASEALVKGQAFLQIFNQHIHSTGVGPSGPPTQPMTPATLSQKVKTS